MKNKIEMNVEKGAECIIIIYIIIKIESSHILKYVIKNLIFHNVMSTLNVA